MSVMICVVFLPYTGLVRSRLGSLRESITRQ